MTDDDALREAAEHFLAVNDLWEDEDLDIDDHVAVLVRNFTSSDCADFACVVAMMTGWPTVRASWAIPDVGFGHHTLVRSPEGRLLDASGWTDEAALRKRYLGRRKGAELSLAEAKPLSSSIHSDEDLQRVASVVRALPHAPFSDPAFREMSSREVSDPDPESQDSGVAP